jgi:hypothetical protein
MERRKETEKSLSRRNFLGGAGIFMAGGVLGCSTSFASTPTPEAGTAPPLPWNWVKLDPMEAGSLAYHYYFDIGS